jgi:signal transduction histidine kinase
MRQRSSYLASAILSLIVILAAGQFVWILAGDWRGVPAALDITNISNTTGAVTVVIMSAVGWLIAVRKPENSIGWVMLAIALLGGLIGIPPLYAAAAIYHHVPLPAPDWVYLLGQLIWMPLIGGLLVVLPMVFPTGRLLSRRWLIPIGLFGVLSLFIAVSLLDPASTGPIHNPIGNPAFAGLAAFSSSVPFALGFVLISASGIASLFIRYRRADERERQQLKWLLAAVSLLLAGLALSIVISPIGNLPIVPIGAAFLPIGIGIAVLRYRLYDIDLIINRALVYGGLAAIITAAYVLVVIGIGTLVGNSRQFLLSIVTTAVLALAFQPLRVRAQRVANRLVYGKRATPYETLSQFSEHLSETFSQEAILDRMSRILAQGTGADRAEVWVRAGSRLLLASSSPETNGAGPRELRIENGALPELPRDRVAPVTHQGELLGALAVVKKRGESMNAVEEKLVADLAGQAGLLLRNVGLNRELLARLEDLRASRQRLVTAQDEERRRIERNIHDGAQQHLVALKLKVGLAESLSAPDSKARSLLAQLKKDADEAIDTLRELARGIYPPLLASDGLDAALRSQTRRLPFPIELAVDQLPRQPREVESAIYFCCLEALQNIAKYAQASRVQLRIWTQDSTLAFTVRDDGKGFDPASVARSSGLQNMRDRLEALGGSLDLESAPGNGTTVAGRVPLTS